MDYKRKYEQAMLRMNKWVEGSEIIDPKEVAEFVFPELKESEDERIRKEILEYFQQFENEELRGVNISDWIAWFEKHAKQKPAWSEEDEKQARQIERIVHNDGCSQKLQEQIADWLKSLKERYTWKPSDGQMKQLGWVAEQNKDNMIGKELMSLYQDLKKLREE